MSFVRRRDRHDEHGRRVHRRAAGLAAALGTVCVASGAAGPVHAAAAKPDLPRATAYLTSPTRLVDGHFYESFPGFADFGLTIDGALALAGSGGRDASLKQVVAFLDRGSAASGGQTINSWTGIGTSDVSGGSLGKEALLAEVTGYNPRSFAGHDVLSALDSSVCTEPIADVCAARGNYRYATSVFSQALAVTAQLRAHHSAQAAASIGYLESLQNGPRAARSAGAWPSLIPGGGADVDSTAMAVMALNMVSDAKAKASVRAGLSWLASAQSSIGGFPGVEANSTNSTGLAVQALSLGGSKYVARIAAARKYLASRQNSDGGFDPSATTDGSDVRASTQALSGAVGTSFATLTRTVAGLAAPASTTSTPSPTASRSTTAAPSTTTGSTATPPAATTHRTTTTPATSARTTATPSTTVRAASASGTTEVPAATSSTHATRPAHSIRSNRFTRSAQSNQPVGANGRFAATQTAAVGVTARTATVARGADPAQVTTAAGASAAELANTGTHTAALTQLAAALTGLGALLTLAGRRRRPAAHRRSLKSGRHR